MVAHFFERLGFGSRVLGDSTALYLSSPVLIGLAAVPTVIRSIQVVRGRGTPEGSVGSEAVVGLLRVALALAIVSAATGWSPFGSTAQQSQAATAAFDQAARRWQDDLGEVVFDLTAYALIYGGLNILISGLLNSDAFAALLRRVGVKDRETAISLTRFAVKNQTLIPISLVHLLRVLGLLARPAL
jgi:hypothetical protein